MGLIPANPIVDEEEDDEDDYSIEDDDDFDDEGYGTGEDDEEYDDEDEDGDEVLGAPDHKTILKDFYEVSDMQPTFFALRSSALADSVVRGSESYSTLIVDRYAPEDRLKIQFSECADSRTNRPTKTKPTTRTSPRSRRRRTRAKLR